MAKEIVKRTQKKDPTEVGSQHKHKKPIPNAYG